jgi:hypothetical protein
MPMAATVARVPDICSVSEGLQLASRPKRVLQAIVFPRSLKVAEVLLPTAAIAELGHS